jgi:hypothetical protein
MLYIIQFPRGGMALTGCPTGRQACGLSAGGSKTQRSCYELHLNAYQCWEEGITVTFLLSMF